MYGIESVTEGFLWTFAFCMFDHKAQYCGGKPRSKEVASWAKERFILPNGTHVSETCSSDSGVIRFERPAACEYSYESFCCADYATVVFGSGSVSSAFAAPGWVACNFSRTSRCASGQWVHLQTGSEWSASELQRHQEPTDEAMCCRV